MARAVAVLAWIGAVLLADGVQALDGVEAWRQAVLGLGTWLVLAALLRGETALVRTQTLVVVALATCVEYTFSPLLQAYVYRIGTVPPFVPPGHGLVYLAALTLGRSRAFGAAPRLLSWATAAVGGAWALAGLVGVVGGRHDVLGAFWFACLAGFLLWGPNRRLYVGAFVVVSYLELVGTALGTWAWAATDPVLHVVGQGNPPSGAAGGYGWFDLWALLLAPRLLALTRRRDARPLAAGVPGPASGEAPLVEDTLGPAQSSRARISASVSAVDSKASPPSTPANSSALTALRAITFSSMVSRATSR